VFSETGIAAMGVWNMNHAVTIKRYLSYRLHVSSPRQQKMFGFSLWSFMVFPVSKYPSRFC
jgi:hypothetical protein